jgi:hypothetical protein
MIFCLEMDTEVLYASSSAALTLLSHERKADRERDSLARIISSMRHRYLYIADYMAQTGDINGQCRELLSLLIYEAARRDTNKIYFLQSEQSA